MNKTEKKSLNRGSLIYRIQKELKSRILNGEYKPGEKLPSEPNLASELGVSRNTLRESIGMLQREGLLIKKHGIGNFVTEKYPIIKGGLERLTGIAEFIESQGFKSRSEITNFEVNVSDKEICERLEVDKNCNFFILETTKYAEEIPIALCKDIIPNYIIEDIDPVKLHKSVFDGLRDYYGIDIRYAECDLIPAVSDEELSEKLKIKLGTPLLLLEQIHYVADNKRVLYSRSYFPSGKFTFKLVRRR